MGEFKRQGRTYVIPSATEIFGGSSQLARERRRLFSSTFRAGESFTELLRLWSPEHEPELRERRQRYLEETGREPSSALQLESLAWRDWAAANPQAADDFQNTHFADVWESYHTTQQATFLAITHAVTRVGLIQTLDRVAILRGEGRGAGTAQFRLFVVMTADGLEAVWNEWGNPDLDSIHPGYPTSFRQPSDHPPRLQMSTRELPRQGSREAKIRHWRERTDRWADIDIDYRDLAEGHLNPSNSDVTAKVPFRETLHIERHASGYGALPGLLHA